MATDGVSFLRVFFLPPGGSAAAVVRHLQYRRVFTQKTRKERYAG
jgi:hypothetical protein